MYQPDKVERFARLAIDLGHFHRQPMVVIDIDSAGSISVNQLVLGFPNYSKGTMIQSLEDVNQILKIDPYFLIQLLPSFNTPCDALFEVVTDMPEVHGLCVSTHLTIPKWGLYMNVWPMFDNLGYASPFDEVAEFKVFVEIDSADNVYLNSLKIEDDSSLVEIADALLKRSVSKLAVVSVDRSATCETLIHTCWLLEDAKAYKFYIVPRDVVDQLMPELSTEELLEMSPININLED